MVRHAAAWRRCLQSLCVVLVLSGHRLDALPSVQATSIPSPHRIVIAESSEIATRRGGRGPEHCALSIGIFLGGALGFWVNPFLGTQAMRLGLMASVLHC